MNWIKFFAGIYVGVSFVLFLRYLNILMRERDHWNAQDIELKVSDYVSRIVTDSALWPFYIIWYGLKEFIKELK